MEFNNYRKWIRKVKLDELHRQRKIKCQEEANRKRLQKAELSNTMKERERKAKETMIEQEKQRRKERFENNVRYMLLAVLCVAPLSPLTNRLYYKYCVTDFWFLPYN